MALGVTVALGAGAAWIAPYAAITPGALSPGHEKHRGDCLACHAPFRGATRAKCLACHAREGIALRTSAGQPIASPREGAARINGFHRALDTVECGACHREHAGSRGSAAMRFSHDVLPPEITAACADCHAAERPKDRLHAPAAGNACSTCHGTAGWKPADFAHERWFRFDDHHPPRCAACHDPAQGYTTSTCYGCHEHTPARVEAEHREERITNIERCARCHRSGNEHDTVREGMAPGAGSAAEPNAERREGKGEDDD